EAELGDALLVDFDAEAGHGGGDPKFPPPLVWSGTGPRRGWPKRLAGTWLMGSWVRPGKPLSVGSTGGGGWGRPGVAYWMNWAEPPPKTRSFPEESPVR